MTTRVQWAKVPGEMQQEKFQSPPCRYDRVIYLTGGSTTIELFDLRTFAFKPSPCTALFPVSDSVCWITAGQLAIISKEKFTLVSLLNGSAHIADHKQVDLWPRAVPVVVGERVFWVRDDNRIYIAAIDQQEITIEQMSGDPQ